jgi:hypothetical protein
MPTSRCWLLIDNARHGFSTNVCFIGQAAQIGSDVSAALAVACRYLLAAAATIGREPHCGFLDS